MCVGACFLAEFRAVTPSTTSAPDSPEQPLETSSTPQAPRPRELGGREGPDPTRYGDWELNGRCIDF